MKVERPASPALTGADRTVVVPKRVRPTIKTRFVPVEEYENSMFVALRSKESLAEAAAQASGRKARLPRFSLLRGEVALLAERVLHITRGAA